MKCDQFAYFIVHLNCFFLALCITIIYWLILNKTKQRLALYLRPNQLIFPIDKEKRGCKKVYTQLWLPSLINNPSWMDFALTLGMRIKWESCYSFSHVSHIVTLGVTLSPTEGQQTRGCSSRKWDVSSALRLLPRILSSASMDQGTVEKFLWNHMGVSYLHMCGVPPNLEEWELERSWWWYGCD